MNKVSIIIPVRNEERYIKDCIESIINFDYNKEYLEVLFVDGMSDDKTVTIIESYMEKYAYIKVIKNEKKIVPSAMNLAIKASFGDYICRLDAHAKYPVNYISELLNWSKKLDADNVGAVCITDIKSKSNIAKAIQFVMSDKLGVGNSLFRIGVKEPLEVDTVPFGFYKKEVFNKIGFYDERLVRVQDLELNKRLKKNNGKIFLVPDITCTYYPRETFKSFFKNRFDTGKWVILSLYFTNSLKSISFRHLIPLFFTSNIILSFLLGFLNKYFFYFFISIVVFYSSILFLRSLKIKKDIFISFYILFGYFILHFSYGLGSLCGIFEILKRKIKK
ncbi:glycosyltransferase [Aliarcobacter butzleri RM4018]|uniref:Glycosyltransferase n=1 Tax=Aliarcobacter butzleri (strain RM4018) TaxID=367737 RepID=A8ESN4_ALIB4|nr:glycosyltransferase family 2 protein [Aliarcobacter butzleri]ABV66958.1 glycosyltransferase [Aliarcobacter butzleri RM4018]GGT80656.1 glycosyl transferase [Aliarcobacter butzleri]SNV26181.1 Poly-beta-1,6-N-acetyl-D-glucosamine synthase [Aliarcobacter butzleri]